MTPSGRPLVRRPGVALAVLLATVACTGPGPTPIPSRAPSSTASPTLDATPAEPSPPPSEAASPSAAPSEREIAADPGAIALEIVAEGLSAPIGLERTPDGLVLVHERGGRVLIVDPETGERSDFLDITDRVLAAGGEQGLLGVAVDPYWPSALRAYIHYTDGNGNTVVSRFWVSDLPAPPRLDPTSEEILLQVEQPFSNHNGGQLAFGPDGMLYVGLGDGGSGGDPFGNGQNADVLLGKVLRLDVAGNGPYAIPDDNPFADGGGAPEVLLTGLRNPWRFSFDPATGLLWIADVGQNRWEEVNRVDPVADAGANLGWNIMEAAHCYDGEGCAADGLTLPVAEYGHDAGCSVTGGLVYRGAAIPDLWGWYVFSDYCSGTLFGIPSDAEAPGDGTALAPRVLLETGANVSAFGTDADGELLLADIEDGLIYRIVGG